MAEKPVTTTRFEQFGMDERILKGLNDAGFEFCTPIQAQTLPIALAGRDVAGQAQTGTGKTAAFLVAMFQYLLTHPEDTGPQPQALVLAPTRELAIQIHREAVNIGKHCGLRLGLAYGGTGYKKQLEMVKSGVDVLIGTPGRIIDFHRQHAFSLKKVQAVVLDEADRMFDLGFIKDLRYLLRRVPPRQKRLGLLFSATLSYRVTELAYEHMNNPELVRVEAKQMTSDGIEQKAYFPSNDQKHVLLIGLLRALRPERSIVFVNTKRAGDTVRAALGANGFQSAIISGDVPQQKRQRLLLEFQQNKLPILIATDVAARGLHIPDVSHVFNYDLPQDVEDYVHRIGRTARLGATGVAISLVCEEYVYSLPEIEEYIGMKIPVEQVTDELLPEIVSAPARRNRSSNNRDHLARKKAKASSSEAKPKSKSSNRNQRSRAQNQQKKEKPLTSGDS